MYMLEINGSRPAVKQAIESGLLVEFSTSNGGGGVGAGQLCAITSEPYRPLEKAITTDTGKLGPVYRYSAGRHGAMNITALDGPGALETARGFVRPKRRRR